MNKHAELCSVSLLCCLSLLLRTLFPSQSIPQIVSYLLINLILSPRLHRADGLAAGVDKTVQSSSALLTAAFSGSQSNLIINKTVLKLNQSITYPVETVFTVGIFIYL